MTSTPESPAPPAGDVVSTGEKELKNHPVRGRSAPSLAGRVAICVFSLPFIAAGAAIIWNWFGIPVEDLVPWQRRLFGMIFFVPGVLIALGGIRGFFYDLGRKQRIARHQREPWLVDYDWDARGSCDDTGQRARNYLLGFIFLSAFLSPFHYFIITDGAWVYIFPVLIVGVFDVIAAVLFGTFVYHLIQRVKYGRSRLYFDRFPFFLGESLDVRWEMGRPLGAFRRMDMTLRCVEERQITRRDSDGDTHSSTVCFEIYSQVLPIDQEGVQQTTTALPIAFSLPDAPATQFTAATPRYWELEIHADTPGVDYDATFLVPVYAKTNDPAA